MQLKHLLLLSFWLLWGIIQSQTPQFHWAKQLNSDVQINSIITDSQGNLYSVGAFSGTVDFDPSNLIDTLTDKGQGDIFILKMDVLGNLVWVKHIGGASYDEANSITIDANDNIYIAGFFNMDSIDFDPGPNAFYMSASENSFVLKLDSNGNFIWAKQISSLSENYARSIALDKQNNILVTGRFEGTANFDPNIGTSNITSSGLDLYVWKLDNNGNFIWAKQLEAIGTRSYSIATDGMNNIFVTGVLVGTTDFDPSSAIFNLTSNSTFGLSPFMLKLDNMGNFIWVKQLENVSPLTNDRSVLVDSLGNSYYAGEVISTTDFDPNAGTHTLTPSANNDHYILQLTENGDFSWVNLLNDVNGMAMDKSQNIFTEGSTLQKFNSTGLSQWVIPNKLSNHLTIDYNNNIYSTGSFSGTADFDPDSTIFDLTSNGDGTFIQKISVNAVTATHHLVDQEQELQIFPNPNNGHFYMIAPESGQYVLVNNLGQVITTITLRKNEINQVELSNLVSGLYFIRNSSKFGNKWIKIMVGY